MSDARTGRPGLMALACAALLAVGAARAAPTAMIPAPLEVVVTPGAPTVIASGERIIVPERDAGALFAARQLARLARASRGLELRPRAGPAPGPGERAIVFIRNPHAAEGPEGYRLDIGSGQARITAATDAGLFYGAASLWQLMTADGGRGPARLAAAHIEDSPRFAWRGLLLDSARHFQSTAEIERLIDAMALLKLNVLQWHLTDDQGWRLPVPGWPRLTTVGAWRTPAPEPWRQGPSPAPYGSFYTEAQIRRIVAFAAARNVTVVPEIDTPGHSLAAILAYPQLGFTSGVGAGDESDWGVFPAILDPSPATLAFVDAAFREVMRLFPGRFIAIGGDEAVKDAWRVSPEVQARMRALGLADEDALQAWFTRQLCAFLLAHGRTPIGWDDILSPGLPPSAAIEAWRAGAAAAGASAGHEVVVAAAPTLYFDNRQSDLPGEPPGRGLVVSLHDVLGFQAEPAGLSPAARAHIRGIQGALWSEHIRSNAELERMALPRLAALAELGWSATGRIDWTAFAAALPAELARERRLGLKPDEAAIEVKLEAHTTADGSVAAALSDQIGAPIRYRIGGEPPNGGSPLYRRPIPLGVGEVLTAAAWIGGARAGPILRRAIERPTLARTPSQRLGLCSGKLPLNLEDPDGTPLAGPVVLIDIMDPCWIDPAVVLDGMGRIRAGAVRLPFNFQIGADLAKVVVRPPRTRDGEFEVRLNSCAGPLLASIPLAGAAPNGLTELSARLPRETGRHDLCLTFTRAAANPMWALDWVQLGAAAAAGPRS